MENTHKLNIDSINTMRKKIYGIMQKCGKSPVEGITNKEMWNEVLASSTMSRSRSNKRMKEFA